jgi:hypothetical protein
MNRNLTRRTKITRAAVLFLALSGTCVFINAGNASAATCNTSLGDCGGDPATLSCPSTVTGATANLNYNGVTRAVVQGRYNNCVVAWSRLANLTDFTDRYYPWVNRQGLAGDTFGTCKYGGNPQYSTYLDITPTAYTARAWGSYSTAYVPPCGSLGTTYVNTATFG